MVFRGVKNETLNLRVSPSFKRALKKAADGEQRSMVNMLEVLLSDYCARKDINCNDISVAHLDGQKGADRKHDNGNLL